MTTTDIWLIALAVMVAVLAIRHAMLAARLAALKAAVTKTLDLLANDDGLIGAMQDHNKAITHLSQLVKRTQDWYADEGGIVRQVGGKREKV